MILASGQLLTCPPKATRSQENAGFSVFSGYVGRCCSSSKRVKRRQFPALSAMSAKCHFRTAPQEAASPNNLLAETASGQSDVDGRPLAIDVPRFSTVCFQGNNRSRRLQYGNISGRTCIWNNRSGFGRMPHLPATQSPMLPRRKPVRRRGSFRDATSSRPASCRNRAARPTWRPTARRRPPDERATTQ
jgi:hypothetical protein